MDSGPVTDDSLPSVDPVAALTAGAGKWWRPIAVAAMLTLAVGSVCLAAGVVPLAAARLGPAMAVLALVLASALLIATAGLVPAALILRGRSDPERATARLGRWGGWRQAVLAVIPAEAALTATRLARRIILLTRSGGRSLTGSSIASRSSK